MAISWLGLAPARPAARRGRGARLKDFLDAIALWQYQIDGGPAERRLGSATWDELSRPYCLCRLVMMEWLNDRQPDLLSATGKVRALVTFDGSRVIDSRE